MNAIDARKTRTRGACALSLACLALFSAACGEADPDPLPVDDVPLLEVPAENVLRAAEDLAKARRLLQAGAESDAETLLVSVIGNDPQNSEAWALLGRALRELGRHGEAVPVLRRAIEMAPRDAASRRGLGDSLDRLGQLADAEDAYREWLEIEPRDADARFQLGTLLYRQEKFGPAVRQLTLASNARQSESVWRSDLGLAQRAAGDLELAEQTQRTATERDPLCGIAWLRLGNLVYERDPTRLPEALDALRRAVEITPGDVHAQVYLYRLLRKSAALGDAAAETDADACFRRVVALHAPRQLTGARPNVRGDGGDRDAEVRRLRSQVDDMPDDVAARTRLARLLHARGDIDESLEHYDVLVRDTATAAADTLADAGAANLLRAERERAVALLRAAVAKDPAPLAPQRHLAWALLEMDRVDEALAACAVARAAAPDDRLLALGEGLALMRSGELEAGLVQISRFRWLD